MMRLQEIIFIIQTHSSKGAQKNMLKAWNFTENKLRHRCFDYNSQKIFRTNILGNSNRHICDSYFDGQLKLRQLTDLNFKWRWLIKMIPYLLSVGKNIRERALAGCRTKFLFAVFSKIGALERNAY